MRRTASVTSALLVAVVTVAIAQQQLDRSKPPVPGKVPELKVPTWTTSKLSNGAQLIVAERRGLPLISLSITFQGGANQFESADKLGVSAFTTAMLREGTKTRDADALALALQMLGTNVGAGIGDESGSISFLSTTEKFAPTLDILADMLLNPTFPAPALERLRAQRLVALANQNAQPGFIGGRVFSRVLYGAAHPFGQVPDEATIKAVTRDDVAALFKEYFQPGRAIVTVVGDIDAAGAKAAAEKALAGWGAGGAKVSFDYPPIPDARATTIYLVDKPGAKQSVFNIGLPGPPRNTPDYMALQVMNFILGGHFQSRLNANIREEKGYSYGVNSSFSYGKGPGPFRAGGDIVSDKTDAALVEFMKELRGIQGGRPITDEEMQMAKDTLIQRLPAQFSSVSAIGSTITSLYLQDLPPDYYQNYAKAVRAVTREDVLRVAKKYVDLDHLNIVIVGDRASIEGPLKATGIAPIVLLDPEGRQKS
ncbi:MAG TPA: pitrilysin family protein [Vicinamibacterales bacterium]|jgi:zinc protease|nr:pitrilysin family protein [Vicinamibacterales bacterium]